MMMDLGQFICGEKRCDEKEHLRSWEVLFSYVEHEKKRDALVKLRKTCHSPSQDLIIALYRIMSIVYKETSFWSQVRIFRNLQFRLFDCF